MKKNLCAVLHKIYLYYIIYAALQLYASVNTTIKNTFFFQENKLSKTFKKFRFFINIVVSLFLKVLETCI